MTKLNKPITRELPRAIEGDTWVATFDAVGIAFRRKGARRKVAVSWPSAWNRAMQIAADQLRRERIEKRKARAKR